MISSYLKNKAIKFFNLDLELRRKVVCLQFLEVLKYFKELKEEDEATFEKMCSETPSLVSSRHLYIASNYLSIHKINTIPFKYVPEIADYMKEL